MTTWTAAGNLSVEPVSHRTDLLAEPVAAALHEPDRAARIGVVEIDPDLADTTEFCAAYSSPLSASANCVLVAGKRSGEVRYAAAMVLATTRADVNNVIKRRLDVRKASFVAMEEAAELTGMSYGGITPVGLPAQWPILVDTAVAGAGELIIGSGTRKGKLLVTGEFLASLPGAEVIDALGKPAPGS